MSEIYGWTKPAIMIPWKDNPSLLIVHMIYILLFHIYVKQAIF